MGTELKRDTCPMKYCKKGSLLGDSLPVIGAMIIVALFSGNLFISAGINTIVSIIIEAVFIIAIYSIFYVMFGKVKDCLAETYISVCKNGVCGICHVNGFKNVAFELTYAEITKMIVSRDRLTLFSAKGRVPLTLNDAQGVAAIIRSKNFNL